MTYKTKRSEEVSSKDRLRGKPAWRKAGTVFAASTMLVGVSALAAGASSVPATHSSAKRALEPAKAVSEANAQLKQYSSSRAPAAPGPSFKASKAKGKLVWLVEQEASNPAVSLVASSFETAITHEHVRVLTCNANGESVDIPSCMQSGLAQHPSAIVVDGGDPTSYTSGTTAAKAAHVPVISALDVPVPFGKYASALKGQEKGIAADAGPPDPLSGTLAADLVVSGSHDHAHVLFISSPGILGSSYEETMFGARLKQLCSSCTVDAKSVEIPNWPTDLGPLVTAQLSLHKDINYVVPVFDPMAAYTDPAIVQAGKSSTVKVVTVNGSLEQMENLSAGQVITGEVGQSLPELGFEAADEALRYLSGAKLVHEEQPVVRVFTSKNIHSVKMSSSAFSTGAWYDGSQSALSSMFYKLWNGKG